MSNGERWTNTQFQKWVEAMDYKQAEIIDRRTVIPYDVELIAIDLGLSIQRIRVYWNGSDHGEPLTIPCYIVRSCRSLLALKRIGDTLRYTRRRHPHLVEIIDPLLEMVKP